MNSNVMQDDQTIDTPVFPYYLDEEMVMSFLATIDDGLSIVRKVSQTIEDSENGQVNGETEAGINWLPFKIGAKVGAGISSGTIKGEQWESERQYPTISLFNLLRQQLFRHGIVKSIDVDADVTLGVGDIVEFTGSLRKNPILELKEVWEAYRIMRPTFVNTTSDSTGISRSNEKRSGSKSPDITLSPDEKRVETILSIGSKGIDDAGLLDVRIQTGHSVFENAVLTLRMERDPAQAIAFSRDSKCKVIGKITGITSDGNYIPLYRRSGLSLFPLDMMEAIFAPLRNLPGLTLDLDDVAVRGPAIQILPLAIFV